MLIKERAIGAQERGSLMPFSSVVANVIRLKHKQSHVKSKASRRGKREASRGETENIVGEGSSFWESMGEGSERRTFPRKKVQRSGNHVPMHDEASLRHVMSFQWASLYCSLFYCSWRNQRYHRSI
jgi:hypothetical protein